MAHSSLESRTTLPGIGALRTGKVRAEAALQECLGAIDAHNGEVNAYLSLDREGAAERARQIDALSPEERAKLPLAGVPFGIKDVLTVEGMPATASSKILEGYRPPYTATAVQRLIDAGAVLVGKLNCDEFAMGSSNENSAYGPVKNPRALDRVPGGSSGGSAAAVAAN